MYFIGVDQSMNNTGWAIIDETAGIACGNIKCEKLRGARRLAYIRDAVTDVLVEYRPEYGALEGGAYAGNGQIFQLGGVHALVEVCFWDHSVDYVDVAPVQLKKFVTGKSGAKKDWVKEAVEKQLPELRLLDDNTADAAGLACVVRAMVTRKVRTRAEAEVVHALADALVKRDD